MALSANVDQRIDAGKLGRPGNPGGVGVGEVMVIRGSTINAEAADLRHDSGLLADRCPVRA